MGITVRVKLKMSWIIMVTMFVIVFLNIAFIINEIIKSIMFRNKKQMQEVDPDVKGTEGDEHLKGGKGSPHGDDGIAIFNEPDGKKPKRINPKKIKANKDDISSQNSGVVSSLDGKKTAGGAGAFRAQGSSGQGSSGDNNIINNSSNDSSDGKTPQGEKKAPKDIRKSGYNQTAIQNQISMRRAGQGLGDRAKEDFADDVLIESDAGFDEPQGVTKKPTRKTRKKKIAKDSTAAPGAGFAKPDAEGDMF